MSSQTPCKLASAFATPLRDLSNGEFAATPSSAAPPNTDRSLRAENQRLLAKLQRAGEFGLKLSAQVQRLTAERDEALAAGDAQRKDHEANVAALWERNQAIADERLSGMLGSLEDEITSGSHAGLATPPAPHVARTPRRGNWSPADDGKGVEMLRAENRKLRKEMDQLRESLKQRDIERTAEKRLDHQRSLRHALSADTISESPGSDAASSPRGPPPPPGRSAAVGTAAVPAEARAAEVEELTAQCAALERRHAVELREATAREHACAERCQSLEEANESARREVAFLMAEVARLKEELANSPDASSCEDLATELACAERDGTDSSEADTLSEVSSPASPIEHSRARIEPAPVGGLLFNLVCCGITDEVAPKYRPFERFDNDARDSLRSCAR